MKINNLSEILLKKYTKQFIGTTSIVVITVGTFGYNHLRNNVNETRENIAAQSASQTTNQKVNDAVSDVTSAASQKPLRFNNTKQLKLHDLDNFNRAVDSHIQLKNNNEPKATRETLTVNPAGWHNYKFNYQQKNGQNGQAWLMARGHLVGYQFSGLNNEVKNLVPETQWVNSGNFVGMDDSNSNSMLYYENRLDDWLAKHPNDRLDYQVSPMYRGSELIPRSIRLAYVGYKKDKSIEVIRLGSNKEQEGNGNATVVYLANNAPNAVINYQTGMAKPKQQ